MMRMFVYGTLLPGESNHYLVKPYLLSRRPGRVRGRLYDAGPYPGIVLGGSRLVTGEWMEVEERALPVLDELEGYYGPGRDNEYERVKVSDADKPELSGWIYVWPDSRGFPEIPGGSWVDWNRERGKLKRR